MNDRIRVREVLLIDDDGTKTTMPTFEAMNIARDRGLDLVEVAPTANPPVCRILDYGKFKYEQAKKEREAHKHQKQVVLREVRFKPKIGVHDVDFKTRVVQKLLQGGDKVKVSVMFRGREITHPEIGRELLNRVAGNLGGTGTVEKQPSMEGRFMNMIIAPVAPKPEAKPKAPRPERRPAADAAARDGEAPAEGALAAALRDSGVAAEPADEPPSAGEQSA
ncbi:MAG TPA: translation initiation factor IF-3 [Dehalococcoidia bacterium]